MKYFIIAMCLFLGACSTTVPVKRTFPTTPSELTVKCPELEKVADDTTDILQLLKAVIRNYSTYYQCASKVDGWNNWYEEQKKLFDSVDR